MRLGLFLDCTPQAQNGKEKSAQRRTTKDRLCGFRGRFLFFAVFSLLGGWLLWFRLLWLRFCPLHPWLGSLAHAHSSLHPRWWVPWLGVCPPVVPFRLGARLASISRSVPLCHRRGFFRLRPLVVVVGLMPLGLWPVSVPLWVGCGFHSLLPHAPLGWFPLPVHPVASVVPVPVLGLH